MFCGLSVSVYLNTHLFLCVEFYKPGEKILFALAGSYSRVTKQIMFVVCYCSFTFQRRQLNCHCPFLSLPHRLTHSHFVTKLPTYVDVFGRIKKKGVLHHIAYPLSMMPGRIAQRLVKKLPEDGRHVHLMYRVALSTTYLST